MAGYFYNWGDKDITDEMTKVKCTGMISKPGEDGYGGTNWCFMISSGVGQQWHIHFNGGADGRKVNVIRYKKSSTDSGGDNMMKWADTGTADPPTDKRNLKGLVSSFGNTFPQHSKLLTALDEAIKAHVEAAGKKT